MENFRIIEFDPDDRKQMDLMTRIHSDVLPDSFVVMMGPLFMKQFYYKALPKLGFLKCFLAEYNNEYVGMIVTNKKPFSLIRSAIPHYFIRVCAVMSGALLMDPRRIAVIVTLLKYKPDPLLKRFEDSGKAFEILTIGVLEKCRSIVLSSGKKISHLMLHHAVDNYVKNGYEKITGQILNSNKSALGFYSKYNAIYLPSSTNGQGVILDLDIKKITG